jgi:arylsulfatase A-like enzyme
MDPHDPYFEHPYNGRGYARAAHEHPDLDEAPELRRLYDGEITYWDEHFGRLVEDLKRRGLYDDLTIVITADHGEEFGEHGGFWHGTTLYDEQLHVPLFVKLPGNARGGTNVRHWVQSIDLMPTLLMRSGIEIPEGVQGVNAFDGSDRLYAEENHEGNVLEAVRERRGVDEFKLILANEGNPRGLEPAELYRVDRDAGERNDLARTDTDELHRMADVRDELHRRAVQGAVERQTVDVGASERERLQAIGYEHSNEPQPPTPNP